jgi:energy-coupling factor transporter ATP-binding protein EcfA2
VNVDVRLEGVSHVHSAGTPWARPALSDINLRFSTGDRVLVTGSNGSGKSTLAWVLAGLIAPTEGVATRNGISLVEEADDIGLLLQHARLQLLRPTVAAELGAFGCSPERIRWAVEQIGFPPSLLDRPIDSLSVGQQRRVGLAVLVARGLPFMVLDEPMAGLDPAARTQLIEAVDRLPLRTTIVTVTHDLVDSAPLGTRVIHLDRGRVVRDGLLGDEHVAGDNDTGLHAAQVRAS